MVCISLILLNTFIFFFLQAGDQRIRASAYEYYETSGLLEIELRAYLDELRSTGSASVPVNIPENPQVRSSYVQRMLNDDEFMSRLEDNLVILPGHEHYRQWRSKRDTFNEMMHQSVISRYGYSPREGNLLGLFTSCFLHGSIMHLLGNMVFLWLVGAILEKAMGSSFFVALYCLCGIGASGLFGLAYPDSGGPLIGASGAIAGLMGSFGVVFALRKIRVFYSLGFYFNYATVPAISLFPIWLAKEFYQLFALPDSHVAYMAHIGGLLSGLLLGAGYRVLRKDRIEMLFQEEEANNELESLLENGMEKYIELDMQGARQIFLRVLDIAPTNRTAVQQLYAIDKAHPDTSAYHRSAHRLLQSIKPTDHDRYLEVFREYKALAGKPRLTPPMFERLCYCYLISNDFNSAAQCVSALLKRSPENAKIPGFLLKLVIGFLENGKDPQAAKCYSLLRAKYAMNPETTEAGRYMKRDT